MLSHVQSNTESAIDRIQASVVRITSDRAIRVARGQTLLGMNSSGATDRRCNDAG